MKNIMLSSAALLVVGTQIVIAGGDIAPVEPVVPVPVVTNNDTSDFYIGLGLSDTRVFSTDSKWFGVAPTMDEELSYTLLAGYNFNEYIGIEGRYSKSFTERDYADTTVWSIFLKPQYRFWETDPNKDGYDDGYFTVYGLLGFGNTRVEGTDGDNSNTSAWPSALGQDILNKTGFQWGLGVSYTLVDIDEGERKNTWSVFIDYTRDASDASISSKLYHYLGTTTDNNVYDKLTVDALTVGLIYTF